ncbi:MAG TPA: TIGR04282 family arsenosugar biosynthesis glycosyltransferase [Stellaceae bacterium]|nr:TIGR04282 family arsenosugar biosynthesis glycosyltransferase [Stellaceae bacterium]
MSLSGMTDRRATCALAVMAKAPRVGEVKTRLVPPLLPEEAARLGECFLRDITANFLATAAEAPTAAYVAYSPPGSEAVFRDLLPPEVGLVPSRRAGLAHSLPHASEDLLAAGYGACCLVNADSPTLSTSLLLSAVEALRPPGDRMVLGPALDGGYYLIGLKHPHQRLFEEIDWSTERVFRQTVERAAEIGLETVTLPSWYDVDDAESLGWLGDELIGGKPLPQLDRAGYTAPHTAAFLRDLIAAGGAARLGIDAASVRRARA